MAFVSNLSRPHEADGNVELDIFDYFFHLLPVLSKNRRRGRVQSV